MNISKINISKMKNYASYKTITTFTFGVAFGFIINYLSLMAFITGLISGITLSQTIPIPFISDIVNKYIILFLQSLKIRTPTILEDNIVEDTHKSKPMESKEPVENTDDKKTE